MRVQSNRPLKNGGWLHPLNVAPKDLPPKTPPSPTINSSRLIGDWLADTKYEMLQWFSELIGVTIMALQSLECAWAAEHHAWAFPMRDGYGNRVGIRLRSSNGQKWAVRGSHQGLFIPMSKPRRTVYITEGPTDTAAVLSLGLYAVGRPSCTGSVTDTKTLIKRMEVTRAIVIADNDGPGLDGAKSLTDHLHVPCCVYVPPAKDIREFVKLGGTADLIESSVRSSIWTIPKFTV